MLTQRRADPSSVADELMTRYTFPDGHPFSRRLAGPARTLSTLTREDVRAFHESFFVPRGAWICAAGDVTVDQVAELAQRWFGDWKGAPPPARVPEVPNRFDRTTIVLADRPGSVQSEVRVGHVGMERTADDFFAATVMNAILGGVFASRLNMNLRERLGYTYGASSSFGLRKLPGTFSISSAIQSDKTAHAVSEMLRDMRRMQDELAPADEVADAAGYLAGIFPLQLQTTDGLAGKLSTLAVYGFPDDYYDHYREGLLAVRPEDVRQAARRRLMPDRAAVVVVGDASELRGPLEALDIGPVEVVDAEAVLG
jgi:zinc protease